MAIPRLVVAAPRSGEGKTTIALGLMAALRRRGLRVQGFKVGPDYLDTTHQAFAAGVPGRNLDLWLMGEAGVRSAFLEASALADVAIVEGVMGLFDGHRDGVTPTSTAEVAKRLKAPVVLVLDASHANASLAATALGFRAFDGNTVLGGVILNRWRSHRDKTAVTQAFAKLEIPLLGFVPPGPELCLPSRHLGVVGAHELGDEGKLVIEALAREMERSVDLDALLALVSTVEDLAPETKSEPRARASDSEKVSVGIARDEAFFFYYQENLEALARAGAELVFVSPRRDAALPAHLDALYLGGGYPEIHAAELSGNGGFLESLRVGARRGLPIFAECGGFMYLTRALTDAQGVRWPLVGLVPGEARMHSRLQGMGYREARLREPCWAGEPGLAVRGHEFHYSSIDFEPESPAAFDVGTGTDGFAAPNILASYLHLHFSGCPELPLRLVQAARKFRARRLAGSAPKENP